MFLEIRHLTRYQYAAPVRESVMELWVQPMKSGRQRLISFDLELLAQKARSLVSPVVVANSGDSRSPASARHAPWSRSSPPAR